MVLRLAAEVDVGDATGGGVAADAIPIESTEVGLVERHPEGEKRDVQLLTAEKVAVEMTVPYNRRTGKEKK